MLWRKSSAWQCALQMYYKFSAGALGTTIDLMYKSYDFRSSNIFIFFKTSHQSAKFMTILKVVVGSIGTCLNALVMATIENRDPAHKSVCLSVHTTVFNNTLSQVSPTKKLYIVLAFWKRFEHPNFPWKRYFVRLLSATLVWLLHLTQ